MSWCVSRKADQGRLCLTIKNDRIWLLWNNGGNSFKIHAGFFKISDYHTSGRFKPSAKVSIISDHNLVDVTPKLKKPRINPCKVTVRSYKNYKVGNFLHDLSLTPFHIISVFDDLNDQVDAFPDLFWNVQNNCAPVENKGSSSLEWIQIFRLEGDPSSRKSLRQGSNCRE